MNSKNQTHLTTEFPSGTVQVTLQPCDSIKYPAQQRAQLSVHFLPTGTRFGGQHIFTLYAIEGAKLKLPVSALSTTTLEIQCRSVTDYDANGDKQIQNVWLHPSSMHAGAAMSTLPYPTAFTAEMMEQIVATIQAYLPAPVTEEDEELAEV